jgi:hypothetical protein
MANPVVTGAKNESLRADFSSEEEDLFFFEIKNQRIFVPWRRAGQ